MQVQQAFRKANGMSAFIARGFEYRSIEVLLHLLVRLRLEYWVQFWSPHLRKNIIAIKGVQRRFTRLVPGMEGQSDEERWANLACFGMTTPATVSGKVFLIFYGLVGCAATILFFNLFLERLITILAYILKTCHERQLRRSGVLPQENCPELGNAGEVDSLAGWKPSVYYVMLILGLAAIAISCCASAMYTPVEGWSYLDSIYFCFVAFSTIGFGDLVSSQNMRYDYQGFYRFGNFLFILMGVCCIYSLFNVISIVIKQFLNWSLRRLECRCCVRCQRKLFRPGRNAVAPGFTGAGRKISIETDAFNESEVVDGRRLSGEMISMRDFLAANKVSLAIMQKQLLETANGHPRASGHAARHNGFSEGVGALAIMNNRLAETSVDR
ncbi:potassium channel subfamily K member 13a [Scyliorhinus canicula]|uniref:potassium channel subfamily K member 13a n=1 Tax=Scyliorhinus canicula TaxID=7830 RepID=UPI0018F3DAEE|nr:potassium channel subfamily K member 13a [Scyliorhinus canicula]